MITELMRADKITSKDMFVDAGTALDGFAGVGSRDFNRGKRAVRKYCENVLRQRPGADRVLGRPGEALRGVQGGGRVRGAWR